MEDTEQKLTKKKHITVRFGLILGWEVVLLFTILTFAAVRYVRKFVMNMCINDTMSQLVSESNVFKFHNSRFMQEMRIYTMADPVREDKSVGEIVSWLVDHQSMRGKEFKYVLFVDKSTGLAYQDNGNVFDASNTDYFKAMTDGTRTQYISSPKGKTLEDGEYLMCKENKADSSGFFVTAIALDTVRKDCEAISLPEGAFPFVLAEDGTVMYYKDYNAILNDNLTQKEPDGVTGLKPIAEKMIQGEQGYGWINAFGERCLIFYKPIAGVNWYCAFSIPYKVIFGSVDRLRTTLILMTTAIGVVLLISVILSITIALHPLRFVERGINKIGSGNADLTQRLPVTTNDEVGSLTIGFNNFMGRMQKIIGDVKDSKQELVESSDILTDCINDSTSSINSIVKSIEDVHGQITAQFGSVERTTSAVNEISGNIEGLEKMIASQVDSVESASESVQNMVSNIGSVNDSVEVLANSFEDLTKQAENGITKQKNMSVLIDQIEDQSKALQQANTVIAGIANTTRLLSMNAAIEAAHAGTSGQGFAVVAEEIRKLSETSAVQSHTIRDQLKVISSSIKQVVVESKETSKTFESLTESIQTTDKMVGQIKESMAEQMTGSSEIDNELRAMKGNTQEVKAASEEMSSSNRQVIDEVKQLKEVSDNIKNSVESMSSGAQMISTTGKNLSQISTKMDESMVRIGAQIDAFKV